MNQRQLVENVAAVQLGPINEVIQLGERLKTAASDLYNGFERVIEAYRHDHGILREADARSLHIQMLAEYIDREMNAFRGFANLHLPKGENPKPT